MIERLDYLQDLGVNAVELLPVQASVVDMWLGHLFQEFVRSS